MCNLRSSVELKVSSNRQEQFHSVNVGGGITDLLTAGNNESHVMLTVPFIDNQMEYHACSSCCRFLERCYTGYDGF